MKNFTPNKVKTAQKRGILIFLFSLFLSNSFGQTSYVDVTVNWPAYSSENRVEIYNPSGTLISTIDNGFTGGINNSYSTTVSLGCITDANNYYITMYDTANDGWDGAANITITSGGTTVLTNSGASANTSGTSLSFNVFGGCSGSCSSTVSSFPYTEGFESGIGQWTHDSGDDFNWTRDSNGTPSYGTGPSGANGGNWYMYTEASSNYSNTGNLLSPCFDLTPASSAQFSFYVHMYGSSMGTLNVDLSTNGGLTFPTNLWSQSGQIQTSNGASWNLVNIDLTPYIGQTIRIRFSGNTGPSYRSDIAIDDITLTAVTTPQAEIEIQGNAITINDGDATPNTSDNTDFGTVNVASGANPNSFTINNIGTLNLNLTGGSPYVAISGVNASDFTLTSAPTTPIASGSNTNFTITFDPTGSGLRTAIVSIANDDSNENPYTFYIQGYGDTPLTEGPGGVTSDLQLWLKANDGAGISDNQALATWFDQAKTNNATVNVPGQEPTYRDNANNNVNYNPVVDFDNDYNSASTDYSYSDTSRNEMQGSAGYYSDDMYVVIIPDINITSSTPSLDIFCADSDTSTQATDGTGIGFGRYSIRFDNEVLSYAHGTTPSGSTPVNNRGYGVAQTNTTINYDNVGIINARHNTSDTNYELLYNNIDVVNTEVGVPQFNTVSNANYWLGRSEGYRGSLDGRILEIITFSSRKNNSPERNRIESYLAIKYGITLGVNGVSQDYVASDGNIIWNVSANSGYNYDIAGIGRDDDSDLNQKQSKSVNNSSIVSLSLDNTELTNNINSNTFNTSNEFLVWGNNGQNTNSSATSITVSLGPATITTVTDVMNRTWKIVETAGDDVGKVEISVFESDLTGLPALSGNDSYVLLVADDPSFTTNIRTSFLDPSSFNGQATREGTFDFDGTKYFTIGIAHEAVEDRHLEFDGIDNYTLVGDRVDLAGNFTASAWVKPQGANALASNKTIVAKNDGTVGYKLYLTNTNYVGFSVGTNATDRIDSNTQLPDDIWHHVAVTYNGSTARIYIDGVLDATKTITSSTPNGSKLAIGAVYIDKLNIVDFFKGGIDEVRIWDDELTVDQLHYVMNQELVKNGNLVNGTEVPNTITKNEIEVVNWNNLLAYYNMNTYIGTHLNDASGNGNRGSLAEPSQFDLEYQSSPLPYISTTNGNWDNNSSWANGSEQYIPGSPSIVDPNITVDWNIVQTNHNITLDNSSLPSVNNDTRSVLGLNVTANELTVNSDNGLVITHYLKVDGLIDLVGESQLIQTQDSDLDVTSSGSLERDQQGTADTYTYNYWSSPVSIINNISNNTNYTIPDLIRDGTNPSAPVAINFLTSGYNGSNTNPIGIADYWIWKFANQLDDDYSAWQHVRSTGTMLSGEGFTLKGPGTGSISTPQNYVFVGKPNNGDITLSINAGNDYLIGNPYPSAINAHEFLNDNPNTGGTIYFWEHWGGGSHNLGDYQGGYALYNFSGGTGAASYGTNDPDVGTGGTPTKLPGQYIPVSQGFFVYGATTGNITFENDQRIFVKEGTTSTFVRTSSGNNQATNYYEDDRMKFRIGFNSFNQIHRQLLLTVDNNATAAVDWGYDGKMNEQQIDDMYWMIEGDKYAIQGTNQVNTETVVPLGIHVRDDGMNSITIDHLENVPDDAELYVFDNVLNIYHDLRQSDYQVYLTTGEYLTRFSIVFTLPETLSTDANEIPTVFEVFYNTDSEHIVIQNPTLLEVESLQLFNILGQSIFYSDYIESQNYTEVKVSNLSTGTYIVNLNTEIGKISKKILVN